MSAKKAKKQATEEVNPEQHEEASQEVDESKSDEEVDTSMPKEDAKRAGIRESATNSDVVAIKKKKAEKEAETPEEEDANPSYFVDEKKKHRIEVDILSSKETGQVVSVSRKGLGIDFAEEFDYLHCEEAWFEFTAPSYEDMSTYRQRCGVYRQEAKSVIIDRLQLRNFLIVWHLKDWNLTDAKGKKIKLKHDKNGSLDDECMKKVYAVHPTIIDVVLTVFEKDVLLT